MNFWCERLCVFHVFLPSGDVPSTTISQKFRRKIAFMVELEMISFKPVNELVELEVYAANIYTCAVG